MTKGVYLPSNFGSYLKFFQNELVSSQNVVYLVRVVAAKLIVLTPTSSYKFKSSFFNELPNFCFHFGCLLEPPHAKELHLIVDKGSVGVLGEFFNNCIQGVLN